jgi:ferritin-like metal-binding protein YciE
MARRRVPGEMTHMAETKTLHDALVDELRDIYHAEKQLVKALPKMAKAAGRDELREALENHLAETEQQVSRLEQVFEQLDERPKAKPCAGMQGIVEEGSEMLKEDFPESVMDALIIAAAQRAEHYEMAAYGTVAAWADQLGQSEIAELLRETLEEEKHADALLTELAESGANQEAMAGGNGARGDDEGDDEDMAMAGGNSRRRSSSSGAARASKNQRSSQSGGRASRGGAKRSRR